MDDTVAAGGSPPPRTGWPAWARSRSLRLLLVIELLVVLVVIGQLWSTRRQVLDAEDRHLGSLAAAMAAQADATLDTAAAALSTTRDELARGLLTPGTPAADALLHARLGALPRFRLLAITDAQGRAWASSGPSAASLAPLAADSLAPSRDGAPDALQLSLPQAAGPDGQPAIVVSMDWRDAAGRLQGRLVLLADPEFLDRDFPRLAPAPDTRMAIYREDRALIADGPGDHTHDWLPLGANAALWADLRRQRPHVVHLADGDVRLLDARALTRAPLLLVVSRQRAAVLAPWAEQAWLLGAFAASALLVTLVLGVRTAREQALRRASEAALALEQARTLRAFQAAQEGAWEWDPARRQTYLSPRMKDLLGLPRDHSGSEGLFVPDQLHPDDVEPLRQAFAEHQAGRGGAFDHVFRVRRGDGGWRHVRARGLALEGPQGLVFSGTASDISDEVRARDERQQLEAQLDRGRRLEALGTLAGGVAHDFNNILASVVGYGEMAREQSADGSTQARQIDQVLQAGQRGKAVVARILAFSRGAPRQQVLLRLQPVVDEVLQLLAASLPPGVQLQRQLAAPDAVVRGDATAVFEAVMNLCTNAMQAMQDLQDLPSGGLLTVSLQRVDLALPRTLFEGRLQPGAYACIGVEDQGRGIPADALPRLFEPFFSTKGAAGTGLGLAVVHGVMVDLGGAIDLINQPGRGARFELYLPWIDDDVVAAAAPATAHADANAEDDSNAGPLPLGDGQAILVVDDEPALVALAEELLAGLGYEPFGVSSSSEALRRFQAEPDRFALLLTDEVMPLMTGTALAEAVHTLRPQLPVIIASGWGGPQFEQRAAAAGVSVRLAKPLGRAELAQALAHALAGAQAADGDR